MNEKLFEKLEESERYLFPVVAFYEENKVIVMKRARMLNEIEKEDYKRFHSAYNETYLESFCSNGKEFCNFIKKYHIADLHSDNVGIIDNKLVVIDAGLRE